VTAAQLGGFAEHHPHPVFLFERETLVLLWVNGAAQSWVQRSSKGLLGSCPGQIMPGMGAIANELSKSGREDIAILGTDLQVKDRAGREWQCGYHIFLCPGGGQTSVDRADKDKIALIVMPQQKESLHLAPASQAVAMLGQMLAHELKNPLAGIGGAAQLLEAGLEEAEDLELTALIKTEIGRIGRLAERMEGFGVTDLTDYKSVNIHTVLRKAALLFQSRADMDLKILETYDPSLPLIYGHEDSLMQLVLNLMANAHEAITNSGGGSQIELRTQYKGMRRRTIDGALVQVPVEIQIIDDGPGIDPELRKRIFQPFVTSKTNGQGLGLALVSKIVEDHGACVELASKPGETIFSILFSVDGNIRK